MLRVVLDTDVIVTALRSATGGSNAVLREAAHGRLTPLVTPALFLGQVGVAWGVAGGAGLAWLWGLHVLLTNTSWAVNSLCHAPSLGRAPHATGDDSRDVPWLSPVTLGEAYHNTHHRYPRSARHGLGGGFDPSWWVIVGLVRMGLASEPWLPRKER